MSETKKPILCLDFDGVLHSYTSGWTGADLVADPPVPGAMQFLWDASQKFEIHIYSSRSGQSGGIEAMQRWIVSAMMLGSTMREKEANSFVRDILVWPSTKPPAMITIDDRAIQFNGTWPSLAELLEFQPWNKRPEPPVRHPSINAVLHFFGEEEGHKLPHSVRLAIMALSQEIGNGPQNPETTLALRALLEVWDHTARSYVAQAPKDKYKLTASWRN